MDDPIQISHIEPLKTELTPQRTSHIKRNSRRRKPTPNRLVLFPPPRHTSHDHATEQVENGQHE